MKLVFALAVLSFTFTSFAATSDTLLLKGAVASRLSIEVTPELIAANLPLDISQGGTKVASVLEKSNSNSGYKVTISSANQGKLVRQDGTEQFPYSLAYDGSPLDLSSSVEQDHSSPAAVSISKDVNITYTGIAAEDMVEGVYSDIVTFSIAAN
jgi:hypothetical protein